MGFLLLVSLVLGAALSALGRWCESIFPASLILMQAVNLAVGFGVTMLLFATAYQILPRMRIAWSDVGLARP